MADGWIIEKGWALEGNDPEGRSIHLVFGETELNQSDLGIVVGRHPALSNLVIDDESVSRRHCRFSFADGDVVVEDLNSLNGTLIDGEPIDRFQPEPILAGERLMLGRIELVFQRLDEQ
ncbi:MAG: FHA domain-containing protein [Geminicoccaceae bacterium]